MLIQLLTSTLVYWSLGGLFGKPIILLAILTTLTNVWLNMSVFDQAAIHCFKYRDTDTEIPEFPKQEKAVMCFSENDVSVFLEGKFVVKYCAKRYIIIFIL